MACGLTLQAGQYPRAANPYEGDITQTLLDYRSLLAVGVRQDHTIGQTVDKERSGLWQIANTGQRLLHSFLSRPEHSIRLSREDVDQAAHGWGGCGEHGSTAVKTNDHTHLALPIGANPNRMTERDDGQGILLRVDCIFRQKILIDF